MEHATNLSRNAYQIKIRRCNYVYTAWFSKQRAAHRMCCAVFLPDNLLLDKLLAVLGTSSAVSLTHNRGWGPSSPPLPRSRPSWNRPEGMGVRGGGDKNHKAGVTMCTHTIKRGRRRGDSAERVKKERKKRNSKMDVPCVNWFHTFNPLQNYSRSNDWLEQYNGGGGKEKTLT